MTATDQGHWHMSSSCLVGTLHGTHGGEGDSKTSEIYGLVDDDKHCEE